MGTYSRWFLPIFLLILAVSAVRYHTLLTTETAQADARYRSEARQLNLYLANTVLPLSVRTDGASVQQVLRTALPLNRNLAAIAWHGGGARIEVLADSQPGPAPDEQVPAWFARLAGMRPIHNRLQVSLPGGSDGVLELQYTPDLPLLQVWQAVRQQAVLSAFNITLIFVLLGLLLASHRKLLARLAQAIERLRGWRKPSSACAAATSRCAWRPAPRRKRNTCRAPSMAWWATSARCSPRCRQAGSSWASS